MVRVREKIKTNQKLATIIGIIGVVVMFFFPSPQENFLYYVGFIALVVALIFFVLRRGKFK